MILRRSRKHCNRLSAQVAYRSCESELSSDIELGQANFYSAELSAG